MHHKEKHIGAKRLKRALAATIILGAAGGWLFHTQSVVRAADEPCKRLEWFPSDANVLLVDKAEILVRLKAVRDSWNLCEDDVERLSDDVKLLLESAEIEVVRSALRTMVKHRWGQVELYRRFFEHEDIKLRAFAVRGLVTNRVEIRAMEGREEIYRKAIDHCLALLSQDRGGVPETTRMTGYAIESLRWIAIAARRVQPTFDDITRGNVKLPDEGRSLYVSGLRDWWMENREAIIADIFRKVDPLRQEALKENPVLQTRGPVLRIMPDIDPVAQTLADAIVRARTLLAHESAHERAKGMELVEAMGVKACELDDLIARIEALTSSPHGLDVFESVKTLSWVACPTSEDVLVESMIDQKRLLWLRLLGAGGVFRIAIHHPDHRVEAERIRLAVETLLGICRDGRATSTPTMFNYTWKALWGVAEHVGTQMPIYSATLGNGDDAGAKTAYLKEVVEWWDVNRDGVVDRFSNGVRQPTEGAEELEKVSG